VSEIKRGKDESPRNLRHRARGGALLPSGPEALPPPTLAQGWGK